MAPKRTPKKVSPVPAKDVLAGIGDKIAADQFKQACKHPHLVFQSFGKYLVCVDCKRRYVACLPDFDAPDFLYSQPELYDLETRHSPNEAARTVQKLPAGVKL